MENNNSNSPANETDEEMTVVLTLDEGDVECSILTIFECRDKDYIALLPKDKDGNPKDEVYIYGYNEDEEGNPSLEYIDDDEYEAAADRFDELLDEAEYDQWDDEQD